MYDSILFRCEIKVYREMVMFQSLVFHEHNADTWLRDASVKALAKQ